MKYHFLSILLLPAFPLMSRAEQTLAAPQLRARPVGTWEIFKLPSASDMAEPLSFDATGQLGKKIVFSSDSFKYDKDFMFFPAQCPRAEHSVRVIPIPDGSIPSNASLNFNVPPNTTGGPGPVRPDEAIEVRLDCAVKRMTVLDFSSGGFLAIYWDGGFFYLKNTRR